MFTLLTR